MERNERKRIVILLDYIVSKWKGSLGGVEISVSYLRLMKRVSFTIDTSYVSPYRFIFLQSVALLMLNSSAVLTLLPLFFSKVLFTISASAFSKGWPSTGGTDDPVSSCFMVSSLGRQSRSILFPPQRTKACSMMFSSSRTFPGKSYPNQNRRA